MALFEEGLISIIIPVFNRETLLPETLNTIQSQTYTKWECIIVDDGSTDSSIKIANDFAKNDNRFKVYSRPWFKLKGANSCRNYGFELSKGEFIQWFDSDDLMSFEMLDKKIKSFHQEESDMLVCKASFFGCGYINTFDKIDSSFIINKENLAFNYFAGDCWFGTPQAMIRRHIISNLKYIFNIKLNRNQETELFVRILLEDVKINFLSESLVSIRIHQSSISGKYLELDISNKLCVDFKAYVSLFLNFKRKNKLSSEVQIYFQEYFIRCLKKMNINIISFTYFFLSGLKFGFFSSNFLAGKIYFGRLRKMFI